MLFDGIDMKERSYMMVTEIRANPSLTLERPEGASVRWECSVPWAGWSLNRDAHLQKPPSWTLQISALYVLPFTPNKVNQLVSLTLLLKSIQGLPIAPRKKSKLLSASLVSCDLLLSHSSCPLLSSAHPRLTPTCSSLCLQIFAWLTLFLCLGLLLPPQRVLPDCSI